MPHDSQLPADGCQHPKQREQHWKGNDVFKTDIDHLNKDVTLSCLKLGSTGFTIPENLIDAWMINPKKVSSSFFDSNGFIGFK